VLVEARIIEATSRYFRDLGISGRRHLLLLRDGEPDRARLPAHAGDRWRRERRADADGRLSPFSNSIPNPNFAVKPPGARGHRAGRRHRFAMGSVDNTINMNLRLTAAEATGMLRILSSPASSPWTTSRRASRRAP
jgi:type IV pilus assembly protein PilQ